MKQSEEKNCRIVRDLLPNYIEKLTDEVTNEFIEEHIATCEECKRVLRDMNGKVEVEELDQDNEIKYLKVVNKKVKRTIAIVSLIVIIIASCVSLYIYNKSKIQVNNYTFLRAEYVREDKEKTIDGNVYSTLIAVIDPKGKCKSVRVVEKGYTESAIQEQSRITNKIKNFYSNVGIINDELHYNTNIWNGLYKNELESYWTEEYKNIDIDEI